MLFIFFIAIEIPNILYHPFYIIYKSIVITVMGLRLVLVVILLTVSTYAQPTLLTVQNWKQNFGCELKDYQYCEDYLRRDWFIMFLLPGCGHCKRAHPQFQNFYQITRESIIRQNNKLGEAQLYKILQNSLQMGIVDCKEQNQLCRYFNVNKYPQFTYITADKKVIESTYKQRTKEAFLNFTKFHDPQIHSHCKQGQLAHTIWDDVIQVVKDNWVQFLVFGVAFPTIIGYCLGQLTVKGMQKFNQRKTKKQAPKKDEEEKGNIVVPTAPQTKQPSTSLQPSQKKQQ